MRRGRYALLLCTTASLAAILVIETTGDPAENVGETPPPPRDDPAGTTPSTAAAGCDKRARSFEPLTDFVFWGRRTNTSFPCPAAGMNNQVMMILSLLDCASRTLERMLRFKDITCSPTGGKDGRTKYAVGGVDYDVAWFRWSEVFDVRRIAAGETVPRVRLCLADEYSWSEHKWMKACKTTVSRFYGTPAYWDLRRALPLHDRFSRLAERTITAAGATVGEYVSAHIRRGDYAHFCADTSKSSGVRKFLTPPYAWMKKKNATSLSSDFFARCAPSDDAVVRGILTATAAERRPRTVWVASNSKSAIFSIAEKLKREEVRVMAWAMIDEGTREALLRDVRWPRPALTREEEGVLDTLLIALGRKMILNRYSTFSHSAVDLAVLKFGEDGFKVWWW